MIQNWIVPRKKNKIGNFYKVENSKFMNLFYLKSFSLDWNVWILNKIAKKSSDKLYKKLYKDLVWSIFYLFIRSRWKLEFAIIRNTFRILCSLACLSVEKYNYLCEESKQFKMYVHKSLVNGNYHYSCACISVPTVENIVNT